MYGMSVKFLRTESAWFAGVREVVFFTPSHPCLHPSPWPTHKPACLALPDAAKQSAFLSTFQEDEWCRGRRDKFEKQAQTK